MRIVILLTLGLALLALPACAALRRASTPTIASGGSLVSIPAGWFWMGADDDRRSNQPRHHVYLDAYAIQLTEVTRRDYDLFLSASGYQPAGWQPTDLEQSGDLPVVGVLWKEANTYCHWLGLRLPSEAEWEKAARGEDGRRYPWGDTWDPGLANTAESQLGAVLPVGSFPQGASPYGILDLCGNAAEWVADGFDPDYYLAAPLLNPDGPTLILDHVLRGGSFASPPEQATTYFRDSSHSAQPNPRLGFRCARSTK